MIRLMNYILLAFACPLAMGVSGQVVMDCSVSREYITIYNYLKSLEKLKLEQSYLMKMSDEVIKGCSGAAGRFIDSFEVLQRAEMDAKSALNLSLLVAQSTEKKGRAFLTIFKSAYARDILDLDVYTATSLARKLSLDADHVPSWIDQDFLQLSRFCVQEEGLAVDRPRCAELVVKLLDQGMKQESVLEQGLKYGMFKPFTDGYAFLTQDQEGPQLATYQALELIQELLMISPYAVQEFSQLYKFMRTRAEMPLTRDQAINKARMLAKHTKRAGP